jgi:diacylglycerol kinase family enzyme
MEAMAKVDVELDSETPGHVDGEPIVLPKKFTVQIITDKLKIRIPDSKIDLKI